MPLGPVSDFVPFPQGNHVCIYKYIYICIYVYVLYVYLYCFIFHLHLDVSLNSPKKEMIDHI